MILWKIAWQNMLKHGRRTLLILFSVGLSVAVILFVSGMVEGLKVNFFKNMLAESGHIQILPEGEAEALNPFDLDLLLTSPDELIKKVEEYPAVERAEQVLSFGAMLLAEEKNMTIAGYGVDPDSHFFAKPRVGIIEGNFLADSEVPGIAVSLRISELLDLSLGDPLVVLVEDSTGSPWYVEYPVTGIFETDSREFDENHLFLRHDAAEELLYVPGQTREIRVLLKDQQAAGPLAAEMQKSGGPFAKTEIKAWEEIHGSFLVLIELFDLFIIFINLFTVIVAATVITNSILMNVFERSREYGTLRAIGMKRRQLFGLVLTEGLVQGCVGSLAGLALGIPPVLYFQEYGMQWGEITESLGLGASFTFAFSVEHMLWALVAGVLIACAGSLYAGLVSARMSIMDALSAV